MWKKCLQCLRKQKEKCLLLTSHKKYAMIYMQSNVNKKLAVRR
nr:MAG TPA: hypothetical protein [Caudoviricetes sp.]